MIHYIKLSLAIAAGVFVGGTGVFLMFVAISNYFHLG